MTRSKVAWRKQNDVRPVRENGIQGELRTAVLFTDPLTDLFGERFAVLLAAL